MKTVEMEVTYLDHMGSDINVVNAARVSFDKTSEWVWEKDDDLITSAMHWKVEDGIAYRGVLSQSDTKLIQYLAKHNHWSPLAHTSVQIRVKAPIFMARQFVKHQVGLVWNEVSRRYVDSEPEFWFPKTWRKRAESAKQGSSEETIDIVNYFGTQGKNGCEDPFLQATEICLEVYNELLEKGVCPEQARAVLPQNTMTEWVWTGSLVAFARVCKLRLDPHAQKEAQELAQKINDVVAPLYPVSWQALMEHMRV